MDQANKVARELLLTASNARAVALRAGESAAGFKPLTDFIDQLAKVTINSSRKINRVAAKLSRTSANMVRVDSAIIHFNKAFRLSNYQGNILELNEIFSGVKDNQSQLQSEYESELSSLSCELEMLALELRTAIILATLSRVEASQAGSQYQGPLNNVADNVESSALSIKALIIESQRLAEGLNS